MNGKLVSKSLGMMLLILTGAMGLSLGLSWLVPAGAGHSEEIAVEGWLWSIGITLGCSLLFGVVGRSNKESYMLRRDAVGVVGLGWIVCCLFGALPYLFCGNQLSLPRALFESVSGLTTTGATVFDDLSEVPASLLIWRSMTQWIGGMGILTMFVLISSRLGASGKNVFHAESSVHMNDVVGTNMRQTTRRLWMLYLILTLICGVGLWGLGMTSFQALNHAMTATATAGFGTENDSITGFGSGVRLWLMLFMVLCGLSFPLLIAVFRNRKLGLLRQHEETWVFLGILFTGSLLLIWMRWSGVPVGETAPEGTEGTVNHTIETLFNLVSLATTTGYAVGDYDSWPAITKGLMVGLMIVGGCAGSTAGGLKVSRIILLGKTVRGEIRRVFRPNLVATQKLNGREVPLGARGQLIVVITTAAVMLGLGGYLMCILQPDVSLAGNFSAVIAALSNVGPAFAEYGPTRHYAHTREAGLVLLSILMIFGRLEYTALLVLFSRQLWARY